MSEVFEILNKSRPVFELWGLVREIVIIRIADIYGSTERDAKLNC